jgi:hypothetical protein
MLSTPAPVILDVIVDKDECVFPWCRPAAPADMIWLRRARGREGGESQTGF